MSGQDGLGRGEWGGGATSATDDANRRQADDWEAYLENRDARVRADALNSGWLIEAFALFRTGPHQPWHLVDLYDFEFDAKEAMQRGKADMHTDGMVIRHVTLGPVTRWNRPRPRARKTATKRTKAR